MISSPGTGVQHRDSRTMTSSRPSTCTPGEDRRAPRASGRRSRAVGELLLDLGLAAAQRLGDPAGHRLGRHVVLADGGVERVEVGVVERFGDLGEQR
jgi:hypothetical protein